MFNSELVCQIQELEQKAVKLESLEKLILSRLGDFVESWDSEDPDRLPGNREAKINDVRAVLNHVLRQAGVKHD